MKNKKYTLTINMKNGQSFIVITNMNAIRGLKLRFSIKEKLNED